MSTFQRPKTAQEAVLLEIRQRLLDGRFPPGAAIKPDTLGEELGVSAVPVREALRILEGEGQVRYRPHRGYLVTELDIDDLKEIYRMRDLLEAEAVRHAVPKLTEEDLERMRDAIREMVEQGEDVVALAAANRRFHFTLIEAAGMPHLSRVLRQLWDSSDPYRSLYFTEAVNRELVHAEHDRVTAAAAAGDVEQCVLELEEHRRHAIEALDAILAARAADHAD